MDGFVQAAGLTKLATPRTLRHNSAAHLLSIGYDFRTLEEPLGHANVATTWSTPMCCAWVVAQFGVPWNGWLRTSGAMSDWTGNRSPRMADIDSPARGRPLSA